MTSGMIASLVAILGALVLSIRGLRSRRTTTRHWLIMALAWLAIIIGVVFAIDALGLRVV